jgi:hypothetical protein
MTALQGRASIIAIAAAAAFGFMAMTMGTASAATMPGYNNVHNNGGYMNHGNMHHNYNNMGHMNTSSVT